MRNLDMNSFYTRRSLAKAALTAAALLPLARLAVGTSAFADAPALDPSDPTAKALGYVTQSAKPDSKCGALHHLCREERQFNRMVCELG